jgi:hypothetical protein
MARRIVVMMSAPGEKNGTLTNKKRGAHHVEVGQVAGDRGCKIDKFIDVMAYIHPPMVKTLT